MMRKSVRFVATILLAMVLMGLSAGVALACGDTPPCPPVTCEYNSPGYWKNHPEAWPIENIEVGGRVYTKAQAIALMNTSVTGDKSYTMFKAYVAAKLNIASGCWPIAAFWAAGDWLAANPVGSCVSGSSDAWKCGEPLYWCLDAYNNQ